MAEPVDREPVDRDRASVQRDAVRGRRDLRLENDASRGSRGRTRTGARTRGSARRSGSRSASRTTSVSPVSTTASTSNPRATSCAKSNPSGEACSRRCAGPGSCRRRAARTAGSCTRGPSHRRSARAPRAGRRSGRSLPRTGPMNFGASANDPEYRGCRNAAVSNVATDRTSHDATTAVPTRPAATTAATASGTPARRGSAPRPARPRTRGPPARISSRASRSSDGASPWTPTRFTASVSSPDADVAARSPRARAARDACRRRARRTAASPRASRRARSPRRARRGTGPSRRWCGRATASPARRRPAHHDDEHHRPERAGTARPGRRWAVGGLLHPSIVSQHEPTARRCEPAPVPCGDVRALVPRSRRSAGIPVNVDSSWIWIAVLAVYTLYARFDGRFGLEATGALAYAVLGALALLRLRVPARARARGHGAALGHRGRGHHARVLRRVHGRALRGEGCGAGVRDRGARARDEPRDRRRRCWSPRRRRSGSDSTAPCPPAPIAGHARLVARINVSMAIFNVLPGLPARRWPDAASGGVGDHAASATRGRGSPRRAGWPSGSCCSGSRSWRSRGTTCSQRSGSG